MSDSIAWRVTNAVGPEAQIEVLDNVGFSDLTIKTFTRTLAAIRAQRIRVFIHSDGGLALVGIAIYQALKAHPARVTTEISFAGSAASIIAMAGDRVEMQPKGMIMIHEAALGLDGWATAADLTTAAKTAESVSNVIASTYADRAGGTVASWREKMKAETWFDADAAIMAGLADGLVGENNRAAASLLFQVHAGRDMYQRERDRGLLVALRR